jgi:hypothetical protein
VRLLPEEDSALSAASALTVPSHSPSNLCLLIPSIQKRAACGRACVLPLTSCCRLLSLNPQPLSLKP